MIHGLTAYKITEYIISLFSASVNSFFHKNRIYMILILMCRLYRQYINRAEGTRYIMHSIINEVTPAEL